ncbi:response regulator containing a CheY-like receiver domain and an HTH DNA-binding domain [Leptolyngbyaceae cyanobacterium JSC-12]|nr:response regulator containing a CheY-like receiver domain and an HTH DNA-binding domain [Leptolyngbyaceae cyanobacterium JSC-12]
MMPLNIAHLAASLNPQEPPEPEVERLLKELVDQVNATITLKESQSPNLMEDQVMFESCIDGLHYQLVRCRPKTNQPLNLSPRELEIASLIAQGFPNKCIGRTLNISPCTVSTHLRRIFGKLGVTSRAAMIARLMEENLLRDIARN